MSLDAVGRVGPHRREHLPQPQPASSYERYCRRHCELFVKAFAIARPDGGVRSDLTLRARRRLSLQTGPRAAAHRYRARQHGRQRGQHVQGAYSQRTAGRGGSTGVRSGRAVHTAPSGGRGRSAAPVAVVESEGALPGARQAPTQHEGRRQGRGQGRRWGDGLSTETPGARGDGPRPPGRAQRCCCSRARVSAGAFGILLHQCYT
mmetsp:Transcript_7991/g.20445  ORF Transcript_7991/g.20445 Transcript_7991/m.20445 type:complete len:205 (+) Transcript_7991:571-1185(+)